MQYVQEISLDVSGKGKYKYIDAKRGDNASRYLKVTLFANGEKIKPEEGAIAVFRCLKPDGHCCLNNAIVNSDGTVTVELTSQVLACEGTTKADISLLKGSTVLSTVTFFIQVGEAPLSANTTMSSDEFLLLTEKIDEATKATDQAKKEADAASKAAERANGIASDIQKAAETGVFKGEKGDKGEKGEKGDKGDPGETTNVFEELKSHLYAPVAAGGAAFGTGVARLPEEEGWYRVLEMDRGSFLTFHFATDMNGAMTRGVMTATGYINRYGYVDKGVLGKPALTQIAYEVTGTTTAMNYADRGIPRARVVYPKDDGGSETKCYLEIYKSGQTATGSQLSGRNLYYGYIGNGVSLCRDGSSSTLPVSTFDPEIEADEVLKFENHAVVAENFFLRGNGQNRNLLTEKNYRLVNTITVAEDAAELILTQDDEGHPYNYQDVVVHWTVKKKEDVITAQLRLDASDKPVFNIGAADMKAYDHIVAARAYILGGRFFADHREAIYSWSNALVSYYRPDSLGYREASSITKLRFYGSNAVTAGSTIKVYALEG